MTFLKLLSGLVGLFKNLAGLLRDRRLMKAGEDRYAHEQSTQRMDIIRKAHAARRALTLDDDIARLSDRYNRDRKR